MGWHRFLSHPLVTEMLSVNDWIPNSRNKTFLCWFWRFLISFHNLHSPCSYAQGNCFLFLPQHMPWTLSVRQGRGFGGRCPGVPPCMGHFWKISNSHLPTSPSGCSGLSKCERVTRQDVSPGSESCYLAIICSGLNCSSRQDGKCK